MARCSLILSNTEKSLGSNECGPKGLSNFGCLPWKFFPLNYYKFYILLDKTFGPGTKPFVRWTKCFIIWTKRFVQGKEHDVRRKNVLSMDKTFCPIQKDGA